MKNDTVIGPTNMDFPTMSEILSRPSGYAELAKEYRQDPVPPLVVTEVKPGVFVSTKEVNTSVKKVDPDAKQIGGDHYKKMAIQPTEYIISNNLTFPEGCVIKYISRHKAKGGADDIRKAIHFCQLLLKHEYGVNE